MSEAVNRDAVLAFIRQHSLAALASVNPLGGPQAAVVGFVITDDFEIIFDTLASTRKARNLADNPSIAFVIGGTQPGNERTVQFEGITDIPGREERRALVDRYLTTFPDGVERQSWPGLIYLRARPRWIRYSDYGTTPPTIIEFAFAPDIEPRVL
ncbi:MAG: pyridoxamine 5'-phosphate oxidase family protein [Gemmatimonadota bacterium]